MQEPIELARRLPFAFARRFGVAITDGPGSNRRMTLVCKQIPALTTLAEVRRFAGSGFDLRTVSNGEFEQLLGEVYARDSSEAKQMVEDLGDDMDLVRLARVNPCRRSATCWSRRTTPRSSA